MQLCVNVNLCECDPVLLSLFAVNNGPVSGNHKWAAPPCRCLLWRPQMGGAAVPVQIEILTAIEDIDSNIHSK